MEIDSLDQTGWTAEEFAYPLDLIKPVFSRETIETPVEKQSMVLVSCSATFDLRVVAQQKIWKSKTHL